MNEGPSGPFSFFSIYRAAFGLISDLPLTVLGEVIYEEEKKSKRLAKAVLTATLQTAKWII